MDSQSLNGSLFVCGNFGVDMIVAGESCAAQVFGAVFNPFDRFASFEGSDNGTDIAWIDWYFVAETASNVRRDDANTMFWESCYDGEERTMGMGRLRG